MWLPPFGVPLSYAIAITYVCADTLDKGKKSYKTTAAEAPGRDDLAKLASILLSLDCFTWQMFASVIIPGYTIHTLVDIATAAIQNFIVPQLDSWDPAQIELLIKSGPTFLGLATIPFIVHPIDGAVDAIFDNSIRKVFRSILREKAGDLADDLTCCQVPVAEH